MVIDNSLEVLNEIDLQIAHISNYLDENMDIVDSIGTSCDSVIALMEDDSSIVGRRQNSYVELNEQVAKRVNDIEIGVTEARATSMFGQNQISAMHYESTDFSIDFIPKESPRIVYSSVDMPHPYYVNMLINISVVRSNNNEFDMTMVVRIRFSIGKDGSITPEIMMSPRFIRENLPYNPFMKIPVSSQANVLRFLVDKIVDSLANNKIKFDPISIGKIQLICKPSTFTINRYNLIFVSKSLPKRKSPEPLISYVNSECDQTIKIKDKIIEKEIKRHVQKRASLNHVQFKNGFIMISTSWTLKKRVSHIKVEAWVRMDYLLDFTVSNLTNLFMEANLADRKYKINVKRCWPICDYVRNKVEKIILTGINKNKYFEEHIADMRQHASLIKTTVTPFGLQIDMRVS